MLMSWKFGADTICAIMATDILERNIPEIHFALSQNSYVSIWRVALMHRE